MLWYCSTYDICAYRGVFIHFTAFIVDIENAGTNIYCTFHVLPNRSGSQSIFICQYDDDDDGFIKSLSKRTPWLTHLYSQSAQSAVLVRVSGGRAPPDPVP
eukprot:SAG11_NODE_16155_length_555_cov_2.407895_1_plen_100_part_01